MIHSTSFLAANVGLTTPLDPKISTQSPNLPCFQIWILHIVLLATKEWPKVKSRESGSEWPLVNAQLTGTYEENCLQHHLLVSGYGDPHLPCTNNLMSPVADILLLRLIRRAVLGTAQFAEPRVSSTPDSHNCLQHDLPTEATALPPQIQAVRPQQGRKPLLPQKLSAIWG